MTILAIVNQKGGVGKTTTAVTLGHGLAMNGQRVLLVDLDSQGNVADCLGLPEGGDLCRLLDPINGETYLQNAVYESNRERLDVIRSDKTTARLKRQLAGDPRCVYSLYEVLRDAVYNYVILDCAPSVDLLQTAAIVAADYLLVPTRLDQLALKGVRDVLGTMRTVQRKTRWEVGLAGILPTFYDRVTNESYEQLSHLASAFGQQVFPPIPVDTQCRVASRMGRTLWEFAAGSRALMGYTDACGRRVGGYAEVIKRVRRLTV